MDTDYTMVEIFEKGSMYPTHYAGGRYVHVAVANPISGVQAPILLNQKGDGVIQVFAGHYHINVIVG